MILELKPAQQKLLDQADHETIAAQIEEGFAQAERGELVDADQAIQILQERRAKRRIA
jgi:predicted transcriptional regulator